MKTLHAQKRLAAKALKCSKYKIVFDTDKMDEIKEAITQADIKRLILSKVISRKPLVGSSRGRVRILKLQKKKGRRRGHGSRKGRKTARLPQKTEWITKIRLQRGLLRKLKIGKYIDSKTFREMYQKAGGGFFRNKRHIKVYLEEHDLIKKK